LRQRVEAELGHLRKYPYALLDFIDHTELPLKG
jgi:hypothetical protein